MDSLLHPTEVFADALDQLYGALGCMADLEPLLPDYEELSDSVVDSIEAIENAFCGCDATAYRDWAFSRSLEWGTQLDPCDEWLARREPWFVYESTPG